MSHVIESLLCLYAAPASCLRGLYNTALVVRLVLTWFPEPPAFIVGPLS
jgi:hypothetical protein